MYQVPRRLLTGSKSADVWIDELPGTKEKFFLNKQWPLQLEGPIPLCWWLEENLFAESWLSSTLALPSVAACAEYTY